MSEQIYSDMVRKTGKLFRHGALFRQIVQTWRENQAHSKFVSGSSQFIPARTARMARNPSTPSISAQETRYPHEMDTGLKSLATCEPALLEVLDAALNERLELVAGGELRDVLVEACAGALRVTHLAQDATIGAGNALDSQD